MIVTYPVPAHSPTQPKPWWALISLDKKRSY